ncbi:hypothetical protein O7626_36585 [Micromonospora sp. WMMD1102]|uniref:hypothetical protein n=1 Tax=Micromonospora sp. WMMD1102 TaxID=3016105 RepID=UPI002415020C|nr:hypothetical protein [Micromonospora sp. WMMD1102]MDG4791351.1 hypothetical protein [Micromonospora sp. WMMD1102]
MTRSIRGARRAAAVLAGTAAAATLLLSGCGAGQIAETAAKVPTSVGTNAQSADNNFKVRNLSIDYLSTQGYPAGADAPMNVGLYNDSGQAVTVRISSAGARAVVLAGASATPTPAGTVSPSPEATAGSPSPEATAGSPSPEATAGSPSPGGSPSAAPTEGAGATPSAPSAPAAPALPAEIPIPAGGFVILNKAVGNWLQLSGLTEPLPPGGNIELIFDFGGTQVPVNAPVAVPQSPAPVSTPVVGEDEGHE